MYYLVIAKLLQKLVVVTLWKWKLFQKKKIYFLFLLRQLIDISSSHNGIGKGPVKPCPKAGKRHLGRSKILSTQHEMEMFFKHC